MSKTRRSFTKEFKQDAVGLVLNQGYKVAEAARNLGVSEQALGRWVREHKNAKDQAFTGNGVQNDEQKRIRELEAKVRKLEMEKDILKKAAAFFAIESN